MNLLEIFRTALESLSANKLRTLLTMLGVIIGVGSVVTLLAIGTGVSNNITSRIQDTGTNLLTIQPDNRASSSARLTMGDVEALADPVNVPELTMVIPSVAGNLRITAGTNTQNASVNGTRPEYLDARSLSIVDGEMFTLDDLDARTRRAVLGSSLAAELFPDGGAIGQTILVGNVPFKVTGVLTESGGAFGNSPDDSVFIPLTVAQEKLFVQRSAGVRSVSNVTAVLRSTEDSDAAMENITAVLRERHNLLAGQSDDFRIFNQAQLAETLNSVASTLTAFLGTIGAISLVVGGIGIMNIMLVSVTERTREIGVRKAIGARRGSIRLQFLIEALTVTVLAGVLGIGVGVGISALVGTVQSSLVPEVSLSTVAIAFGVSVLVGVIFGLYPAWRASLLSPVEALRYE
jgi:putative ABC transport system permease protein